MIEHRTIADREEWLRWRQQDVTASVVGALFGTHPYETALKLYAAKCGLEKPQKDTAVLRRGKILEAAIPVAVEEQRPEWRIVKANEYFRNPSLRLGCTPDFFIHDFERGFGVLQGKTTTPRMYQAHWNGQPPFWVALQTVTEMMLTGAAWGAVAVLVVDPYRLDCHIFEIPRHAGVERKIEDAVADFWDSIASGKMPNPDFARDAHLLNVLYPAETPKKSLNLAGDNALPELLERRVELKKTIADAEKDCEAIDSEIKFKMADAEAASLPGWHITWKTHHRKEYVVPARDIRTLRIADQRRKSP